MKKIFVFFLAVLPMTFLIIKLTAQNVGIGTTTPNPSAKLHVDLGNSATAGLLINGNYSSNGSVPDIGPGSRMMYYPGKAAFRAGTVAASQWNNLNVGDYSFAAGYNAVASGRTSLSIGYETAASGVSAMAFGEFTNANGAGSIATGFSTMAIGFGSTAMGYSTRASGAYSSAFGVTATSRSYASVVFGRFNDSISGSSPSDWAYSDPLLILGNGSSEAARSNAMVVYKNGNMDINGFTRLGEVNDKGVGAPAVKMKEFFENTATAQGNWRDVPHGLAMSKILSVSILVDASPVLSVQVPPFYSYYSGYEYQYHISATNIVVINSATNSFNILNKPIKILVTYKE